MAELDLARIKRNVAKMAAQNAPEEDIDGYIASEGTSVEAVRAFRSMPSGGAASQASDTNGGSDGITAQPAPQAVEPEPRFGGIGMNTTAGLNEMAYTLAGAPIDAMAGAINLGARGINAVTGSELPTIEEPFGGSRSIGRAMGAIRPEFDPANTEAKTAAERVARGVGQGVAGAVLPAGAVAAAGRAGVMGPEAVKMAERIVGRAGSVGEAALGATGGAGAAIGQEMAPEGYEPLGALAGGIVGATAGMGAATAGRGARTFAEPFTNGGREAMAGRRIAENATDAEALRRSLDNPPDELVPGSRPTTFQQTGDLGIGVLEKDAANRAPDRFADRRGEQNAARIGAMRGLEPGGAPEKVASAIRQRLDDLEAESERMIGAATDEARSRASAIGSPMTPEAAGGDMRGAIEAARARAKENERALWNAVDPDGRMTLGLSNTLRSAQQITKELSPLAQPLSATEGQIYGAIGQAGDTVPLRSMQDLQSNLKAAMRSERMANGESPAYRRMSIVSAGIAKDFDDAVAGRVAQETQAVEQGTMRAEDTLMANFARQAEAWKAERVERAGQASGQSVGAGFGNAGTIRTPPVRPASGGQGEEGSGLRNPSGNPGLSPDAGGAGFDGAAQERLNAANQATRQRAATFDNATLGPIRQRPATTAPYTMPAGVVPQRIFHSGRGSFEAIGQLRAAIGDEAATNAVQGYAVSDILRTAGRPDGTLDPGRLASWRRSHSNALRALPGLDARLADAGRASDAIAEVAAARKAATDGAQKGALGRLLQVDAPEDVSRIVGGVFSAQDAVGRMRSIRQAIGSDQEAMKGLRRAVIEHMNARAVGNTEVGTSGTASMKSDTFQTFVRQNAAALREAGFAPGELGVLDAIAADLQRAGRSISGVKNPGGSDSVQNVYGVFRGKTPFHAALNLLGPAGGAGAGAIAANGSATGVAAGAATALVLAMRNSGLRTVDDLVTDAMLNPERARLLLSTVKPSEEGVRLQALVRSYARSAAQALASQDYRPAPGERRTQASGAARYPSVPMEAFRTGDQLTDAVMMRQRSAPARPDPLVEAIAARGGR